MEVKVAVLGETVMPLQDDRPNSGINAEYFIWRTMMDSKVRGSHAMLEGKIFRRDDPPKYMPGDQPNCRCTAEDVPDNVLVKNDPVVESKAFELYLRKGIRHPVLNWI